MYTWLDIFEKTMFSWFFFFFNSNLAQSTLGNHLRTRSPFSIICLLLYRIYVHVTNLLPLWSLLRNQALEWHCDQIRVCWLIVAAFLNVCAETDVWLCSVWMFLFFLCWKWWRLSLVSAKMSFIVTFCYVCVVHKNKCGKSTFVTHLFLNNL